MPPKPPNREDHEAFANKYDFYVGRRLEPLYDVQKATDLPDPAVSEELKQKPITPRANPARQSPEERAKAKEGEREI